MLLVFKIATWFDLRIFWVVLSDPEEDQDDNIAGQGHSRKVIFKVIEAVHKSVFCLILRLFARLDTTCAL